MSTKECYVAVFKALLGMGFSVRTDTLGKKLSYLSIVIGSMSIFWLWEAMLITYFAIPSKSLPFNNLKEFLTKSDKKVFPIS